MSQIIDNALDLGIRPQARTYDGVHPEYARLSDAEKQETAYKKLEQYIKDHRGQAARAVQRVVSEQPEDFQVRANKLRFEPGPLGAGLQVLVGDRRLGLHDHAFGQVLDYARVGGEKFPVRFARGLARADWGLAMCARDLTEIYSHLPDEVSVVTRAVNGVVRGVVSPSYGREDAGPALEAMLEVAKEAGAIVANGHAGDVRLSLKMMLEKPVQIFPGEWAVVGMDYRTGDYGGVAREVLGWVLRLLCLNGAVTVGSFRRVHIGKKSVLGEGVDYSEKTRDLDARASASALRDIGRAILGKDAVAKMVETARAANAKELDPQRAVESLRGQVTKEEERKIVEKFNSPDVVLLPPGQNAWRWSNAISWLATQTEDQDRKLELERVAGEALAA